MERLESAAEEQAFAVILAFKAIDKKGIESRRLADALEEINAALDEQAVEIDDWREHVIQLLLKPLVDEENDETTGEEYEQSTKLQDEILVYLQILRTVLADRQAAITGQRNFLVEHETKVAARMAIEGDGPFPEKFLELLKARETIKPPFDASDPLTSMRGLVSELRGLSVKLRHEAATGSARARNEAIVVSDLLKSMLSLQTEQTKVAAAIEKEIEHFMDTLNARIEYYRQLQEVSDMVGEYEGSLEAEALAAALATVYRQEDALQTKLASVEAKHRYRKYFDGRNRGVTLTISSYTPQGGRVQYRRTTDVCHLPVKLHNRCLDGLRTPVLQGMHHAVVPGASHMPCVQEASTPV
jgi:E3 ubiquitin-protein ligase SHPRH